MVSDDKDRNPMEDTMMKIGSLYDDTDAEEKMEDRTPVEEYADTATGRTLADLISEMDARHTDLGARADDAGAAAPGAELEEREDVLDDADGDTMQPIDPGTGEPAAATAGRGTGNGSASSDFVAEFDRRLREHIERTVTQVTRSMREEQQKALDRVREIAAMQVRKKEAALRAGYRFKYQEKEKLLRNHYKKVIALANQVSKDKAQLKQAREQFENKIKSLRNRMGGAASGEAPAVRQSEGGHDLESTQPIERSQQTE